MSASRPVRVLVTGLPGSGKTTLAKRLAAQWDVPHVELDRLYYGPGWLIRDEFLQDLHLALEPDAWCLDDFGAPESRDLVWQRAQVLIWLDLPFGVAFTRAVRRTWRRLLDSTEVLPGCYESWIGWGGRRHPVFLALTHHGRGRRAMRKRLAEPRWSHLEVVRLRSQGEVEQYVRKVPDPRGS